MRVYFVNENAENNFHLSYIKGWTYFSLKYKIKIVFGESHMFIVETLMVVVVVVGEGCCATTDTRSMWRVRQIADGEEADDDDDDDDDGHGGKENYLFRLQVELVIFRSMRLIGRDEKQQTL